jgi:hypothetical protein
MNEATAVKRGLRWALCPNVRSECGWERLLHVLRCDIPRRACGSFCNPGFSRAGWIFLGIGSGEALNEQAATGSGQNGPCASNDLVEATEIIRQMPTPGNRRVDPSRFLAVNPVQRV